VNDGFLYAIGIFAFSRTAVSGVKVSHIDSQDFSEGDLMETLKKSDVSGIILSRFHKNIEEKYYYRLVNRDFHIL